EPEKIGELIQLGRRRGGGRRRGSAAAHEPQRVGDGGLHLAPIDDEVDHAFFEQELAPLESVWERLADRLLDHARTGKADERLRFGDVQVAEHREARRDAARRRIGEHADVGQALAVEPRERAAHLRHLHQRQRAFHHPRAAGAADDDDGGAFGDGALDGARDLLADDHTHAPADEAVFHRGDFGLDAVDGAGGGDDRVLHAGRFYRRLEARFVRLGVDELQGIGGYEILVVLDPRAVVEQETQALGRADAVVVRAFRADVQVRREVLVVNDLRAARTLDPEAFRDPAGLRLRRRCDRFAGLLEPDHRGSAYHFRLQRADCRLLRARDVVARARPHGADLPDEI